VCPKISAFTVSLLSLAVTQKKNVHLISMRQYTSELSQNPIISPQQKLQIFTKGAIAQCTLYLGSNPKNGESIINLSKSRSDFGSKIAFFSRRRREHSTFYHPVLIFHFLKFSCRPMRVGPSVVCTVSTSYRSQFSIDFQYLGHFRTVSSLGRSIFLDFWKFHFLPFLQFFKVLF